MSLYLNALARIPSQPQQQCSTADQTMALMIIIERFGLNGALGYLQEKDASKYATRTLNQVVDEEVVDTIGNLPPIDGLSVFEELVQARRVSIRFGLYDAADLVRLYMQNYQPVAAVPGMR